MVQGDTLVISDKDGVIIEEKYIEFKRKARQWMLEGREIERYCQSEVDKQSILKH
jgi:histidinol phosphatase-like enzyme